MIHTYFGVQLSQIIFPDYKFINMNTKNLFIYYASVMQIRTPVNDTISTVRSYFLFESDHYVFVLLAFKDIWFG